MFQLDRAYLLPHVWTRASYTEIPARVLVVPVRGFKVEGVN